jgi:hypothetical protein
VRGSAGCEPMGSNFPHGCCQTPRRSFQWKPKHQSPDAKACFFVGNASQIHLPTTSACSYCLGNCVRNWFKTVSVGSVRLAQCRSNACFCPVSRSPFALSVFPSACFRLESVLAASFLNFFVFISFFFQVPQESPFAARFTNAEAEACCAKCF